MVLVGQSHATRLRGPPAVISAPTKMIALKKALFKKEAHPHDRKCEAQSAAKATSSHDLSERSSAHSMKMPRPCCIFALIVETSCPCRSMLSNTLP